jgi:hypothetical protein
MRFTVNSEMSLSEMIGKARETFKINKFFTVTFNTGKKRTISQNSLSHQWYGQVAAETGEYTPGEIKCLCKLHVGLPIIRATPEGERGKSVKRVCEFCDTYLDYKTYEEKVFSMEFLPVTSLMNTKQLSEYLTGVQYNYARRGVILFFPEDWDNEQQTKCSTKEDVG